MKRRDFLKEMKGLSDEALKIKARELAEEHMKLRFRLSSGQLEQGHRLQQIRRNLARVLTRLNDSARSKTDSVKSGMGKSGVA